MGMLKIRYIIYTSQNTMYCGGEPEHKHVVNKCTREEIRAHNNGILNFTFIK